MRLKKPIFNLTIISVIIASLTAVLLLFSSYVAIVHLERKYIAEKAEQELAKVSADLDKANKVLGRFINPIQYDVAPAPLYDIPLSDELQEHTYEMCRFYNIEEHYELVLAVMWQESNFDSTVVSTTGDHGLMQINECNIEYLAKELGLVDIIDERNNIEGGVYILSTLLHSYDKPEQALMAYNMGRRGAAKFWAKGIYTSSYSRAVLNKQQEIKEYIRE